MLQIVVSLTIIIYDSNIFIKQANVAANNVNIRSMCEYILYNENILTIVSDDCK